MKPTVYIETTVVSYLTAWPSHDLIRAAQQRITRDWWDLQRVRFDLFSSELVVIEARAGDAIAAAERMKVLQTLPLLPLTEAATEIADALLLGRAFPAKASRDAAHVGICAVHGISYLLTWNLRHLANAEMQDSIREICNAQGYRAPAICAPDALFEATT